VDDVHGREPVVRSQHVVVQHQAEGGGDAKVVGAHKGPLECASRRLKGRCAQDLKELH
jgi:hypothetical protein